jgi:hypothetical protein
MISRATLAALGFTAVDAAGVKEIERFRTKTKV